MLKFFRIFMNIHDFFDFFMVFRSKVFCTASYSHVVDTIRFATKFCVGWAMSGCRARQGKNGFIPKTDQKCDFTGVKIAQVYSKSNKPTQKVSQNHGKVINSNRVHFHEKTPTHSSATYAIKFFIKISRIKFPGNLLKIFIS